jgi:hypothetical protein
MSCSNKRGKNWVKFDAMEDNVTENINRFAKGRFEETQQFHEFTQTRSGKYGELATLDQSSGISKTWSLTIYRSPINTVDSTGWSAEILGNRNSTNLNEKNLNLFEDNLNE